VLDAFLGQINLVGHGDGSAMAGRRTGWWVRQGLNL
jgi:hypothetical protein